jgi:hypothetical protein
MRRGLANFSRRVAPKPHLRYRACENEYSRKPGEQTHCTFRALHIIETLEKKLGTFVISSLQASLWKALQILKYQVLVEGYGRLLRDLG